MEIFSQILVSGKPLCHMDIPVDAGESISFSDLLDNPLVSFPFTYTMLQGDDGKKICRFFYVNPDALEAEDFTFKSKLALKDTCVICVWTAERALHTGDLFKIEGTNLPNTMKFSVCCVVDETGVQYGGVFENRWIPNGEEFEVAEIKNEEKDLQKKFCEGIRAVFRGTCRYFHNARARWLPPSRCRAICSAKAGAESSARDGRCSRASAQWIGGDSGPGSCKQM